MRTLQPRRMWLAGGCLLAAGIATLIGCASSQPVRLSTAPDAADRDVTELRPGDPAPNFTFVDSDGRLRRLSQVQGRVTAVMFPDNPDRWPDPDVYKAVAELAKMNSPSNVPVVIVNVGSPRQDTEMAADVLDSNPIRSGQLVMVADPHGSIRDQFGSNATGKFFVIDNRGHIARTGEFHGADSLREPVRETVRAVSGYDSANSAEEW
jgi:hypothetical protein